MAERAERAERARQRRPLSSAGALFHLVMFADARRIMESLHGLARFVTGAIVRALAGWRTHYVSLFDFRLL
jgi:hypothetical protein